MNASDFSSADPKHYGVYSLVTHRFLLALIHSWFLDVIDHDVSDRNLNRLELQSNLLDGLEQVTAWSRVGRIGNPIKLKIEGPGNSRLIHNGLF